MPTYQYACKECDHAFEQVQSFSEDSLSQCPRCDGRLRKVFNAVGVVFKGSGFYRTDSRPEVQAAEAKSGEGKTPEGKTSEGKSAEGKSTEGKSSDTGKSGSAPGTTSKPKAEAGAA